MHALIYATAFILGCATTAAQAHEFWIDPSAFEVAPGKRIRADIRVGENYSGAAGIFNPNRFRRFELVTGGDLLPVEGRVGDKPALNQAAEEGLAVILHVTTDSRLTYNEFEKFERFVTHKAAGWVLDEHAARGFPQSGFVEQYSRYAKSLVRVGAGQGSDRVFGLLTEIVALRNPYTDDVSAGLPVAVLYDGKPRAREQIEVFEAAPGGRISVRTVTTDADGRATIPVRPGHRYMLDSVVLREPPDNPPGVVWESLWANLTFAVPE
ncbi:MAG: DUF4198 domain-containing protein [Paracoccaceae bacterium]|nr:DUF4198 domain-containing protein [Paracoccaceae bacterium]